MTRVLRISRSSVSAGDDIDSHEIGFPVADGETVEALAGRLIASGYLPSIHGGKATWIVEVDSVPVAVAAQQWQGVRFLTEPDRPVSQIGEGGVHFRYWGQADPDLVAACLRDGKPLPDRYGR